MTPLDARDLFSFSTRWHAQDFSRKSEHANINNKQDFSLNILTHFPGFRFPFHSLFHAYFPSSKSSHSGSIKITFKLNFQDPPLLLSLSASHFSSDFIFLSSLLPENQDLLMLCITSCQAWCCICWYSAMLACFGTVGSTLLSCSIETERTISCWKLIHEKWLLLWY